MTPARDVTGRGWRGYGLRSRWPWASTRWISGGRCRSKATSWRCCRRMRTIRYSTTSPDVSPTPARRRSWLPGSADASGARRPPEPTRSAGRRWIRQTPCRSPKARRWRAGSMRHARSFSRRDLPARRRSSASARRRSGLRRWRRRRWPRFTGRSARRALAQWQVDPLNPVDPVVAIARDGRRSA